MQMAGDTLSENAASASSSIELYPSISRSFASLSLMTSSVSLPMSTAGTGGRGGSSFEIILRRSLFRSFWEDSGLMGREDAPRYRLPDLGGTSHDEGCSSNQEF